MGTVQGAVRTDSGRKDTKANTRVGGRSADANERVACSAQVDLGRGVVQLALPAGHHHSTAAVCTGPEGSPSQDGTTPARRSCQAQTPRPPIPSPRGPTSREHA